MERPRSRYRLKLTLEEKAERRRMQYKLHQRRHRARLQDRTAELELEVCQLAETVATLNDERRKILQSQRVFHSRGTLFGAPAQATSECIRQFEYGYVMSRGDEQERFLRCIMAPNVGGPEFEGIDQLMEMSRLYSQLFARMHLAAAAMDVSVVGEMTTVTVSAVVSLYPRQDGTLCLRPNVQGSEGIVQELLNKELHVSGKLLFMFDENGACTWYGPDFDVVGALQRTFGCLSKANACLQDTTISSSTGKIFPRTAQPILQSGRNQGHDNTSYYACAH
jgi:hypothetical protein